MAYKAKSKDTPNIEPAVMTFAFSTDVTNPGTTSVDYIDLSQVASLLNRRFYRQGLNWAVSGIKFSVGAGSAGSVSIQKLPNTWVMANAWVKGFENWRERINEAFGTDGVEDSEVKGRFLDFKIYADAQHHQRGFIAAPGIGNLLPVDGNANVANQGEWLSAKIRLENGAGASVGHEVIAVGANYPGPSAVTALDAVSLIDGYAASRRLPNIRDPNTPGDLDDTAGTTAQNWMRGMQTRGGNNDEFIIRDVSGYDLTPYPFENDGTNTDTMYPGGANQLPGLQIHDLVSYSGTTIGGQAFAKGGNFPCGLVKVLHEVPAGGLAHNLFIQVDLVPGQHRGYLAEPMGDM